MAHCEICGKDTDLNRYRIEGCEMNVCANCSKFGERILGQSSATSSFQKKALQKQLQQEKGNESEQFIGKSAGDKIKNAREEKGLTQEQLAKAIAEKASVIQRIESGHMSPAISTAEKLEKFLGISIVEVLENPRFSAPRDEVSMESEETETKKQASDDDEGFTIADLLKKK
ncbi:MAG: multiprotein bridging factor aMBF1 [Candidatus Nanoarchaeia archaeon]|jgi:putative transcription factor